MIAGCDVEATAAAPDEVAQVLAAATPPALGPGAYALPLTVGWPTGNVSKSFDVNNNALTIGGGATASNPTNGYWNMHAPIEVGQSLAAVGLTVRDSAGAPVLVYIASKDSLSGVVTTWCSGASAGTGLVHSFTFACPGTMPAGSQAIMQVTAQGQVATVYGTWIQPSAVTTVTRPVWPVISYGSALVEEAGDPFGTTPVRKFRAQGSLYAEIPFSEGETIVGFSIELAGDGSVDSNLAILYGTRGGGQLQIGALTDLKDIPASWGTYRTSSFIPTRLSGNGKLSILLGANSPNLYWGHIWPVFSR